MEDVVAVWYGGETKDGKLDGIWTPVWVCVKTLRVKSISL